MSACKEEPEGEGERETDRAWGVGWQDVLVLNETFKEDTEEGAGSFLFSKTNHLFAISVINTSYLLCWNCKYNFSMKYYYKTRISPLFLLKIVSFVEDNRLDSFICFLSFRWVIAKFIKFQLKFFWLAAILRIHILIGKNNPFILKCTSTNPS